LNPLKPNYRAALAFAHDVLASAVCWVLAFWLRLNLEIPEDFVPALETTVAASVPLHALIFWSLGLYRGSWRYASLPDLKRIAFACLLGALAVPALLAFTRTGVSVPRSTFILAPLLLAAIMSGSRIGYRAWKERALYGHVHLTGEPVLVMGAGDVTVNLLREIERSSQWRAVGILDDDSAWTGQILLGVRVLGGLREVGPLAKRLDCRHVIVALPGASHGVRRRAAELASAAGLTVHTVPSYDDLLSGKVTVSQIRRIELEDLLGRDQIVLDDAGLHQLLAGKVVMVTGAGGSIGGSSRARSRDSNARLVLFEPERVRAVLHGAGIRIRKRRNTHCAGHRRCAQSGQAAGGFLAVPAGGGVPRRRLQARASHGDRQCLGGGAEQRTRDAAAGARRA
jgi:FlaA1/EpsC-like NDP-sugar epimerase